MDDGESFAGSTEEVGVVVVAGGLAVVEEDVVDAKESFAASTEEAGVIVVAGELAAVEAEGVDSTTGETACPELELLGLAPPSLRWLKPESEPESATIELVALGSDGGASLAPELTPVGPSLEGGA